MGKRLFLLLLSAPLLWLGGESAYYLIRETLSGWSTPPETKLAKDIADDAAEFKTRDIVRLATIKAPLTLTDKEPRGGDLSLAERDLLTALDAHVDKATAARLSLRILAGEAAGDLPADADLFREWETHWKQAEEVKTGINVLLGLIEGGLASDKRAAVVWSKLASRLLKENEKLPRKFFTFRVQKNDALLNDCLKVVMLTEVDTAEAAHFRQLDELAARADGPNAARFQRVASLLALSWLDRQFKKELPGDAEALIYNKEAKNWTPRPLTKIKLDPAKRDSLADRDHEQKLFERLEFYVEGAGTVPVCPSPRSLLAFAYRKTRAVPLSAVRIRTFPALVKDAYFEQIKRYKTLPDSPIITDWEVVKMRCPEMWPHVEAIQQRVADARFLFAAE